MNMNDDRRYIFSHIFRTHVLASCPRYIVDWFMLWNYDKFAHPSAFKYPPLWYGRCARINKICKNISVVCLDTHFTRHIYGFRLVHDADVDAVCMNSTRVNIIIRSRRKLWMVINFYLRCSRWKMEWNSWRFACSLACTPILAVFFLLHFSWSVKWKMK